MTEVGKLKALRHASYGMPFFIAMPFPTLDYLIEQGFVRCGDDDRWTITDRGQRSLRARKAVIRGRKLRAAR